MPFETKRIVQEADAYLVQVTYTVERRQIITIEGKDEKKALAEVEKKMREEIIREAIQELHLESKLKSLGGDMLAKTAGKQK